MTDQTMTEEQLSEELEATRLRVAELEASVAKLKQAENALRESNARYRSLRDEMLNGYAYHRIVVDDEGNPIDYVFLDVNSAFEELTGLKREDLVGKRVTEALPNIEKDPVGWIGRYGQVALEREEKRFEGRSELLGKWYSVYAYSPFPRHFITIFEDITDRKQVEEELKARNTELTSFINNLPDMAWIKNADSQFIAVNRAFCEAVGVPAESLVSHTCEVCFGEEAAQKFKDDDRRVMEGRKQETIVERIVDARGQEVWLETIKSPIFDELGEPVGTVSVARDITDRKRVEEELARHRHHLEEMVEERTRELRAEIIQRERAENERRELEAQVQHAQKLESLGVLAGGIAHDFNNVLVGILGNAEMALAGLPPHSPQRRDVEGIVKAAHRAAALTNQMLAYSGKGQFVVDDIDLRVLIEDMNDLLHSSVTKKAIIRLDLPEDLPAIRADASQIRQVVMNLVTNASEAIGEERGRITVTAGVGRCERGCSCRDGIPGAGEWPETPHVVLEVADTGCGMDEATKAKMFEPFFTTKFTGRGLGLAAVHGILRGHKAGIEVESEPGEGSTVRVHFPALDHPAKPKKRADQRETSWRGTGTILLADDEEIVRRVGEAALRHLGFSVITAADGVEAIELFRERDDEITCVLLDLTMPRMGGEETHDEIRKISDEVPVILSSGYGEQESTKRFGDKGLAGFIQKPYGVEELKDKLREVLDKKD